MLRVLLADASPTLRSALSLVLETRLHAQIVGEVDQLEALAAKTAQSRPEIVLLDWELLSDPKSQWIELLHQMRPAPKVIVIGSQPEIRAEAMAAQAEAYISKSEPPECVLEVLSTVRHR